MEIRDEDIKALNNMLDGERQTVADVKKCLEAQLEQRNLNIDKCLAHLSELPPPEKLANALKSESDIFSAKISEGINQQAISVEAHFDRCAPVLQELYPIINIKAAREYIDQCMMIQTWAHHAEPLDLWTANAKALFILTKSALYGHVQGSLASQITGADNCFKQVIDGLESFEVRGRGIGCCQWLTTIGPILSFRQLVNQRNSVFEKCVAVLLQDGHILSYPKKSECTNMKEAAQICNNQFVQFLITLKKQYVSSPDKTISEPYHDTLSSFVDCLRNDFYRRLREVLFNIVKEDRGATIDCISCLDIDMIMDKTLEKQILKYAWTEIKRCLDKEGPAKYVSVVRNKLNLPECRDENWKQRRFKLLIEQSSFVESLYENLSEKIRILTSEQKVSDEMWNITLANYQEVRVISALEMDIYTAIGHTTKSMMTCHKNFVDIDRQSFAKYNAVKYCLRAGDGLLQNISDLFRIRESMWISVLREVVRSWLMKLKTLNKTQKAATVEAAVHEMRSDKFLEVFESARTLSGTQKEQLITIAEIPHTIFQGRGGDFPVDEIARPLQMDVNEVGMILGDLQK